MADIDGTSSNGNHGGVVLDIKDDRPPSSSNLTKEDSDLYFSVPFMQKVCVLDNICILSLSFCVFSFSHDQLLNQNVLSLIPVSYYNLIFKITYQLRIRRTFCHLIAIPIWPKSRISSWHTLLYGEIIMMSRNLSDNWFLIIVFYLTLILMAWHVQLVAEIVGTYFLIFAGCSSVAVNLNFEKVVTLPGISIVWGLAVMVLVYSLGHISGAHFNPAVTLAFATCKRFPWKQVKPWYLPSWELVTLYP